MWFNGPRFCHKKTSCSNLLTSNDHGFQSCNIRIESGNLDPFKTYKLQTLHMTWGAYVMTDAPQTTGSDHGLYKGVLIGKYKSDFLEKMSCYIGEVSSADQSVTQKWNKHLFKGLKCPRLC